MDRGWRVEAERPVQAKAGFAGGLDFASQEAIVCDPRLTPHAAVIGANICFFNSLSIIELPLPGAVEEIGAARSLR
jgi:hypothetical protein